MGWNGGGLVTEILKEVSILQDIEDAASECMLLWLYTVEVQRVQKSALNEIREAKEFDVVKWHVKKQIHNVPKVKKDGGQLQIMWHRTPPGSAQHKQEMQCVGGMQNHFKAVCKLMQWQ